MQMIMILMGLWPLMPTQRLTDTLFIYRPSYYVGWMVNHEIRVNGQAVCRLSNNRYIAVPTRSDTLRIDARVTGPHFPRPKGQLTLTVKRGQNHYVALEPKLFPLFRPRIQMMHQPVQGGRAAVRKIGKLDRCQRR